MKGSGLKSGWYGSISERLTLRASRYASCMNVTGLVAGAGAGVALTKSVRDGDVYFLVKFESSLARPKARPLRIPY